MSAVSEVADNHDGRSGHTSNPTVWGKSDLIETKKNVRAVVGAMLGPPGFWSGRWARMEEVLISAGDEAVWPTWVSMFLWFTHCLSGLLSLHLLVMKVLTHCLDVICMLSALGCLLDGLRRFFSCAFGIFRLRHSGLHPGQCTLRICV